MTTRAGTFPGKFFEYVGNICDICDTVVRRQWFA